VPRVSPTLVFILLAALVPASFLLAIKAGSLGTGVDGLWDGLINPENPVHRIIWELRMPRAIGAFAVGALLALAGCLMQVLLRNPLADPYVLGISGGAACMALLGMSMGLTILPVPVLAFAGALGSTLLVFVLARGKGAWSSTRILLTGVVVAAGWGALISLILATGPDASLRSMLYWLMGDLSYVRLSGWWLLPLAAVVGFLWFRARSLNILTGGETQARLLGESSQRVFWEIYVIASLLTALAVSIAGSIGFVGLIIPHLMRMIVGADHRRLLPAAALFGGIFLVVADTAARTLLAPRHLPVGVLTALIGVPLFLFLLNRAIRIR